MRTTGYRHVPSAVCPRMIARNMIAGTLVGVVLGTLSAGFATSASAQASRPATAQTSNLRQILPGSSDGKQTRYVVQCLDRSRGMVFVKEGQDTYCTMAPGGKERCNKNWSLKDAGQSACETRPK